MRQFSIPKSHSCPNLFNSDDDTEDAEMMANIKHRQRAFSMCLRPGLKGLRSSSAMTLHRVQSDSELSNIDKEKTFDARRGTAQTGDLLAKLVVALGGYRPETEEPAAPSIHSSFQGVHGFTDSQILASEQNYNSDWSITASEKSYMTPPHKRNHRLRASSEIRIPIEQSVKVSNLMLCSKNNTLIVIFIVFCHSSR